MTETQLKGVLGSLSVRLCAGRPRAVLFGGFALPIYGVERLTLDLDFLLCDRDLDAFGQILDPLGYEEVLKTRQYAKFRHSADSALDIDTVFVDPPAMDRIWAQRVEHCLGESALPCASLDVMLGTKLHAIRYNEGIRGGGDFQDVLQLLAANHIDPNGKHFRRLCSKYGTPEILERLCRELPNVKTD